MLPSLGFIRGAENNPEKTGVSRAYIFVRVWAYNQPLGQSAKIDFGGRRAGELSRRGKNHFGSSADV